MGFAQPAHERAIERRVEMIGVVEPECVRNGEFVRLRRPEFRNIVPQFTAIAVGPGLKPEAVKGRDPGRLAHAPEGMEIVIALARPIVKGDAQLDAGMGRPDKFTFIDAKPAVKAGNRRNGRFADADNADLARLDQGNIEKRAEVLAERRGDTPSGGAAARNDHLFHALLRHPGLPLCDSNAQ